MTSLLFLFHLLTFRWLVVGRGGTIRLFAIDKFSIFGAVFVDDSLPFTHSNHQHT